MEKYVIEYTLDKFIYNTLYKILQPHSLYYTLFYTLCVHSVLYTLLHLVVSMYTSHIQVDKSWDLYSAGRDHVSCGIYVKNKDGGNFEGHCWPGEDLSLVFFVNGPIIRN